jgi:hypothetical protein
LGEAFPREGQIVVQPAQGDRVRATFRPVLWQFGQVEIQVGTSSPVVVTLIR